MRDIDHLTESGIFTSVLSLLNDAPLGLCLEEISTRVGRDPRKIEPVLELLIHMGRLRVEVGPSACESCTLHGACAAIPDEERIYLSLDKPT